MRGYQQEMWYKIWMLMQLRQLRMGIYYQRRRWLDLIVLDGSYQEALAFMLWLVCYWLDGTYGMYGTLVGRGWCGPTSAGAGTGAPPLAPEWERHHCLLRGGGLWEAVAGTNFAGAARAWSICVVAEK